MNKNILILLLLCAGLFGCSDFLDESPNKNGNNYITTVDDLDNLLQSTGHLYGYGAVWAEIVKVNDDFGLGANPTQYYKDRSISSKFHDEYAWDQVIFDRILYQQSFTEIFQELSVFNTILENIDKVSGRDKLRRKQVKAEAKFYRAYYHFFAVVAYCKHPKLNNGESLGIPYRTTTNPQEVTGARGTVKETMANIYADLSEAEALLKEAGSKKFDIKENFRITLTNLKAFEARVKLYNGDYEAADKAAKIALSGYNYINDLDDSKYDFNYDSQYFVYKYENDDPIKAKIDSLPIVVPYVLSSVAGDGQDGKMYEDREYFISHSTRCDAADNCLPLSDELYDSYEDEDLRKKVYLSNNFNLRAIGQWYDNAPYKKQLGSYAKFWSGASTNELYLNIGISIPEVMLIRAECASRGFGDANAQSLLREIRTKRFASNHTDNIGGTTAEVLVERRRELPLIVRWYDLKRLNAVENANIQVVRNAPLDGNWQNVLVKNTLKPNADFYALPIPLNDINLLGWQQNPFSGITRN